MKKINILKIIRLAAIVILIYAMFLNFVYDDLTDKYIFGLKPIIVKADTMEPYIKDGSIVIVKKTDINNIKDKDVISYFIEDRIVVHRAFLEDGKLKTKADKNNVFDAYTITNDNLQGVVILRINIPLFKSLNVSSTEHENGQSVEDADI